MPTIDIDLEFQCSECGNDLEITSNGDTIEIDPCENCLESKYDEGVEDGKEESHEEGFNEGFAKGQEVGYQEGFNSANGPDQ
jgi:hypothetical protein